MRQAVYGLWSGKLSRGEFEEAFEEAIRAGIRRAWEEGLADLGMLPEDMTQEEQDALSDFTLDQYSYVAGFADHIELNSRENGGLLGDLQYRLSLWVDAYDRARNQAKMQASIDPPLTWLIGPTESHCPFCLWANGRTYRASVWLRYGWEPQKHFGCECELTAGDQYTKLTRGHPKQYDGPTMD